MFPGLAYFAGNDHRVVEACQEGGAGSITACANVFRTWLPPHNGSARRRRPYARADPTQYRALGARCLPITAATKAALAEIAGLPPTTVRPPNRANPHPTSRVAIDATICVFVLEREEHHDHYPIAVLAEF